MLTYMFDNHAFQPLSDMPFHQVIDSCRNFSDAEGYGFLGATEGGTYQWKQGEMDEAEIRKIYDQALQPEACHG